MQSLPRTIWTNPLHFIACAFGFGALPWMPGTWATLACIPIVLALKHFPEWFYFMITAGMIILGIWVCGVTNRDFGTDDHPACAWDEMASFPIVMFHISAIWWHLLLGVILFRFFDILKPWPIRWVDRNWHNGFGVMMDDVLAAIFAWIILFGISLF